jgi:hypothetical protein
MFYTFSQNNSGGSFDRTDDLGDFVVIEADSADDANERAAEFGIYFDGVAFGEDCKCCGDRWYPVSEPGEDKPALYGEPIEKAIDDFDLRNTIVVHYANGDRRTIDKRKNPR